MNEIAKHTHEELIVMNVAIGRLAIYENGKQLEYKSLSGGKIEGDEAVAYNAYLEEKDKLGIEPSVGNGNESDSEPIWYIDYRRGRARALRFDPNTKAPPGLLAGRVRRSGGSIQRGGTESNGGADGDLKT